MFKTNLLIYGVYLMTKNYVNIYNCSAVKNEKKVKLSFTFLINFETN